MRTRKSTYLASAAIVAVAAMAMTGCSAPNSGGGQAPAATSASDVPDKPSKPVTLNILDVAGNQKLTGPMVDAFVKEHPDIISSVTWESAGAPDLVGTIKPQVDSGNLSVDMVLTGNDGLSAGISQNLWVPIVKDYSDRLSNMDNYIEPAAKMQELAGDFGVVVTYYPSGPLLQYNPDVVKDVPSTPDELMAWAKAHPGKFGYARPANSGPGRTFMMGLPYMLGDKDPSDPENGWDKTWAFLKEIGTTINNYPTGTGQVISNMADGSWALIPTTTGWDIEPRATGTEPASIEAAPFDDFTWVTDAHYAVIPKGQSADKISAILLLLQDILTPEQNAKAYDHGYFYPGPAVEGATLDKAPQESQDTIKKFGRDWYDDLIEKMPKATPLAPDKLVKAFDIWDREVGSGKFQEKK
ncbi:extracellular solute-binding protein [Cryobacterium tepidiphilum]|uniref:Extracellular solute-binding protein n=1 Tax=Cryobacterium tepidiphilum TaxID=2486026 RepID=A0A3M8LAQ4_9MICO|nr:extracellular solute-binding protein [Cryobacterium tepidiphilum]RNE62581.1 extracellular solute-binding protein [Cryobacterium tepidiphilum]